MKYKLPKSDYLMLRDISRALDYGKVKSDRRIQVKMPSFVVDALDTMFPDIDRSTLLTKLALQAVLDNVGEASDSSDGWASYASMEQAANDDLLSYLSARENQND